MIPIKTENEKLNANFKTYFKRFWRLASDLLCLQVKDIGLDGGRGSALLSKQGRRQPRSCNVIMTLPAAVHLVITVNAPD